MLAAALAFPLIVHAADPARAAWAAAVVGAASLLILFAGRREFARLAEG
jgi:hypothetical protein